MWSEFYPQSKGMASHQRRTEDLLRLKTRSLVLQNMDGSYPVEGAIPFVTDLSGDVGFTTGPESVIIDSSGNMTVPGNLTVDGLTNITVVGQRLDLSGGPCPAITSSSSVSVLPANGFVGIGKCAPTVALDVSGALAVSGTSTLTGDVSMGGTLAVSGSSVLAGDVGVGKIPTVAMDVSGALAVSGTSTLTGDVSMGGTLAVSGSSVLTGDVGVGKTPAVALDVSGYAIISSNNIATLVSVFTAPGLYSVPVPPGATTMYFEMIGAGGCNQGNNSGTGGYMKGSINVASLTGNTLTIQVGAVGVKEISYTTSSTASYITDLSAEILLVIAGAGGAGINGGQPGAGGGGGIFDVSGVAPGANSNFGGYGGTAAGGGAGGVGGTQGGNRPNPDTYKDVLGGYGLNEASSGGGGYTGGGSGGSGGGGGGGSSYKNPLVTLSLSYAGNDVSGAILPGYGRTGNGGYVSLSFASQPPSPYD